MEAFTANKLNVDRGPWMISPLDHEKDEEDALIQQMNVEDTLSELQSSPPQDCNTTRNQKLAKHILTTLEINFTYPGSFADPSKYGTTVLRDLAEFSVTRGNLELWIEASSLSVTKCENYFFTECQTDIKWACQVFGFSNVRSSLEQMLDKATLREVVDFFQSSVPASLFESKDMAEMDRWYRERITVGVKAMRHWGGEEDLELVFSIIHTYGIQCLLHMHCDVEHAWEMNFAQTMVRFLQEHRDDISSSPDSVGAHSSETEPSHSGTVIECIICRWMTAASEYTVTLIIQDWTDPPEKDWTADPDDSEYGDHVDHVIAFSRFCLETKQNRMCQGVLDKVLEMPGDETDKLLKLLIPTLRGLCALLQEFPSPACSPPFSHFFRQVIEQYCRVRLGSRTHSPQLDSLLRSIEKKFYCVCRECVKLNTFMKQIYVPQKTFLVSCKGYYHFKRQILSARELAKFEKVHSPHGLCIKVIKSHVFVEQRWGTRIKEFREFLSVIGEEESIAKVMGDGYTNLKDVMEG